MKRPFARGAALVALFSGLLVTACGDSGPKLVSINLGPGPVTLTFIGATSTLTATLTDDEGGSPQITPTWSSSNPSAVGVSASGVVTALAAGSASITATADGVSSNALSVTVAQRVSSIVASPGDVSFSSLGEMTSVSAAAADQGGAAVEGTSFSWISGNSLIASVNSSGMVTAAGNGSTSVRASADGVTSNSVPVTVQQVAVTIEITSGLEITLTSINETSAIVLEARDGGGTLIEEPSTQWATSNAQVATVSNTGVVTAVSNGNALISPALGGITIPPVMVTVEQAVASVTASPTPVVLDSPGETAAVTAAARDALGSAVAGATFTWQSLDTSIATVTATGSPATVTAVSEGITAVKATSGGVQSDDVEVFVGSGEATVLTNGQRIDDLSGAVDFQRFFVITVPEGVGEFDIATTGGTGDLDLFARFNEMPTDDFTDTLQFASGFNDNVELIEIANPQAGDWFILVDAFAAYSGASFTVSFRTGDRGLDIDLEFVSAFSASQEQIIRQAAGRWEAALPEDQGALWLNISGDVNCVVGLAVDDVVEDIRLYVAAQSIDGPGGVLAQARPCFIRTSNNLPIVGIMTFDTDDLASMETSGQLLGTSAHEAGHVMGFGTLWNLPTPPLIQGGGTSDPIFIGSNAIQAFDDVGGTSYSGQKVPVENTGGQGTADGHWRESVFDDELMTGFAEAQGVTEKFSIVTIQSFADLGWVVDLSAADAYQLPGGSGAAAREQASPGIQLIDDILTGDLYSIDRDGNIKLVRAGKR